MKQPAIGIPLLAGLALSTFAAIAQEPVERELYVRVEIDAKQSWRSVTEEYGEQHSEGTTRQVYELRTRLRSDGIQYKRNILHPDMDTRLEAKTIHLARQALRELKAAGEEISFPLTPEKKNELTRRMQEEMAACKGDMQCFQDTQMRYAKLFAASQYPEIMEEEPGGGQYLYFEPYKGCPVQTYVKMDLTIEGVHFSENERKLLPFKETRSAETTNAPTDIPLCERYLAVIDTHDEENPFYLENFYVPGATGETVLREGETVYRETGEQPQLTNVLGWVTKQLRHAPASGTIEDTVRLTRPLNATSRQTGSYSGGQAEVKLTWHFKEVAANSGDNGE